MNATQSHKRLYGILDQLIKIPSVTGELKAATEVIERTANILKPTSIKQVIGSIKDYPYLLASTQKPNDETLWFVCHLDVVPAERKMFKVTQDDHNYYGRGVFDMKGMAAAVIAAFLELDRPKDYNIGMLFTADEETGGKNGVGALIDQKFRGGAAFVFDQSSDWVLQQKMKGVLWLEVTASGQAAHGARPWLGHSSNTLMVRYLHDLENWYDTTIPKGDPDKYYTTYNLGTLHGGGATNQVSNSTVATIDIRFTSEEEANKIAQAAADLANQHKNISVKELMHEPCVNTKTSEKWYQKTAQFMKDLGIKPGPNGERFGHGSTDGRFFAPYGIPVITTRPPGGHQHGPNEWVGQEGLLQLKDLCIKLMKETQKARIAR